MVDAVELSNGVRVVVEPMEGARSAVLVFRFAVGAMDEPTDRLGMARIAEDVAFKGTPVHDAHGVFDAFDALGVRRGSSTHVEYTQFYAQFLPEHFEAICDLYNEVFTNASFPDAEVAGAKTLALEELKRLEDSPIQQAMLLTFQAALGEPLGRMPLGDVDTVPLITPAGLRRFWTDACRPDRLIISVAGGVDPVTVTKTLDGVFGKWPMAGASEPDSHVVTIADRQVHHPKESEQEHIGLAFGAVPRGDARYYAGQVAVAVLSGSGSSRLFTEVREKRGLAYSVTAFYRPRRNGGLIALYAGTTADRAEETLSVCRAELKRLAKDVTKEELERAKTILKGGLFTTGDLPENRATSIVDDVFLEGHARSLEKIAAGVDDVTLDQIPDYLEAFPTEPQTVVTLGPKPLA